MGHDLKFKMAAMPIYGKSHSNDFYPRTTRLIRLICCRKHMGHLSIKKKLKSFQLDHKQASSGWGKFGKNDAKFSIDEPFELES